MEAEVEEDKEEEKDKEEEGEEENREGEEEILLSPSSADNSPIIHNKIPNEYPPSRQNTESSHPLNEYPPPSNTESSHPLNEYPPPSNAESSLRLREYPPPSNTEASHPLNEYPPPSIAESRHPLNEYPPPSNAEHPEPLNLLANEYTPTSINSNIDLSSSVHIYDTAFAESEIVELTVQFSVAGSGNDLGQISTSLSAAIEEMIRLNQLKKFMPQDVKLNFVGPAPLPVPATPFENTIPYFGPFGDVGPCVKPFVQDAIESQENKSSWTSLKIEELALEIVNSLDREGDTANNLLPELWEQDWGIFFQGKTKSLSLDSNIVASPVDLPEGPNFNNSSFRNKLLLVVVLKLYELGFSNKNSKNDCLKIAVELADRLEKLIDHTPHPLDPVNVLLEILSQLSTQAKEMLSDTEDNATEKRSCRSNFFCGWQF